MRFRRLWIPFLILLSVTSTQAQETSPEGTYVLLNAHVIDGTGSEPFTADVTVENHKIRSIDRNGHGPVRQDIRSIDLRGRYLLPGFIDAHVHISDLKAARRALLSGVTTARSMGTSRYADIGLRELIRLDASRGPEILAAGYHIRPTMAEAFFQDEPPLASLLERVSGPEDFRKVAAANLRREINFLKVVATDRAGLPDTDPRRQIMTLEELQAVVEEAERAEVPVAAHAHGDAGARAAVEAGVRSIEHGTYLSRSTLELMRDRKVFLVPTVAVVRDLIEPDGDYDNTVLRLRGRHMLPRLQQTVRQAHSLGLAVVAATDTGYGANSLLRIAHDIEELTLCGFSPLEAIQAATQQASRLLAIDDRTGTVEVGKEADLVVVEGDPRQDITVLQDVLMVITDGRIVLDRF